MSLAVTGKALGEPLVDWGLLDFVAHLPPCVLPWLEGCGVIGRFPFCCTSGLWPLFVVVNRPPER